MSGACSPQDFAASLPSPATEAPPPRGLLHHEERLVREAVERRRAKRDAFAANALTALIATYGGGCLKHAEELVPVVLGIADILTDASDEADAAFARALADELREGERLDRADDARREWQKRGLL